MNHDLKERLRDPHLWRRDTIEYITPLAQESLARIEQLEADLEKARKELLLAKETQEFWRVADAKSVERAELAENKLEKARKALELIAAPASFLLNRNDALKMRDTARIAIREISR